MTLVSYLDYMDIGREIKLLHVNVLALNWNEEVLPRFLYFSNFALGNLFCMGTIYVPRITRGKLSL